MCQTWTRDKFPWIVFSSSTSGAFDRARIRKQCEVGVHKTKSESFAFCEEIFCEEKYIFTPPQTIYSCFIVPRFSSHNASLWSSEKILIKLLHALVSKANTLYTG